MLTKQAGSQKRQGALTPGEHSPGADKTKRFVAGDAGVAKKKRKLTFWRIKGLSYKTNARLERGNEELQMSYGMLRR